MSQPHLLMCPPNHFGIEYEINPWMDRRRPIDHQTATGQWQELHDLLISLGAKISLQQPIKGLPDMVFTANAGLIYHKQVILSNFLHPQRQGEQEYDEKWFTDHGFSVSKIAEETAFEGAGDALFCGDTLFAGYRIRSDAKGHQTIGTMLDCRVIPLELVDNYYYHLDTCFCPLSSNTAIYYPAAFDEYGQKVLPELIENLIEVNQHEAQNFACNAVVVGKNVVTNVGCNELHEQLKDAGFAPHETPLSEFVKSGGSAKCLTLRLDGEEAASWKNDTPK